MVGVGPGAAGLRHHSMARGEKRCLRKEKEQFHLEGQKQEWEKVCTGEGRGRADPTSATAGFSANEVVRPEGSMPTCAVGSVREAH